MWLRWVLAVLGGVLLTPSLPVNAGAQIAVVVNLRNPVKDLSLEELRRLYLGRTTTFRQDQPVVLLEQAKVSRAFYQAALGMNEARVRRHWIGIVFSGEAAKPPRSITIASELKQALRERPGAIAFIDVADLDRSMKVVTINGLRPADAHYPLQSGRSE